MLDETHKGAAKRFKLTGTVRSSGTKVSRAIFLPAVGKEETQSATVSDC